MKKKLDYLQSHRNHKKQPNRNNGNEKYSNWIEKFNVEV